MQPEFIKPIFALHLPHLWNISLVIQLICVSYFYRDTSKINFVFTLRIFFRKLLFSIFFSLAFFNKYLILFDDVHLSVLYTVQVPDNVYKELYIPVYGNESKFDSCAMYIDPSNRSAGTTECQVSINLSIYQSLSLYLSIYLSI